MAFNNLKEISVFGYADEFGTEKYNLGLSEKRAMAVAKALVELGAEPTLYPEGKGRLKVPREAFMEALRKRKSTVRESTSRRISTSRLPSRSRNRPR